MTKKVSKNIKSGLLGIFILLAGVIAGILLLGQNQDYRNKAKEVLKQTYTVCHRVGVTDNRWEEIVVKTEDLSLRLNQGDIFGKCPRELLDDGDEN